MLSVSLLLDSSTIVIESQAGHLHQVILSAAAAGCGHERLPVDHLVLERLLQLHLGIVFVIVTPESQKTKMSRKVKP